MSHVSEFIPAGFIPPLARSELINRSFDAEDDVLDDLEHFESQARRVRDEEFS